MKKSWYQKVHLWGQVNLTEDDPEKCDLSVWKDYWKKSRVEGIIVNCGGIVSYYQSRFKYQYQAQTLGKKDYFKEWIDVARSIGLAVVARMDINCTGEQLYQIYPNWYCKDQNQNPILSQSRYVTCINGGYYGKFIPLIFQEIIEKYHPDGFADNSWAGLGSGVICYCENCRKKFREECGEDLPKAVNWSDPVYRKWIRWNYKIRSKTWKYFDAITREYGGEDCRWFGMVNANPFRTGGRFYDLKELVKNAPFIFCDHQSRDEECGFEQNILNGELLKSASDENVTVAESMAHYYKGSRTFRLSSAEPCEVRKWMMCGIGGGIAPWFHFVSGQIRDKRKLMLTDDIFRWSEKNRNFLVKRKNSSEIGVVWNQETITYYGRDQIREKCEYPWLGITRTLSQAGLPFWPVHADDVEKYAERLQLLILPNLAVMTEKQEEMILNWLGMGKALILTGDTSLYDGEGEWKGSGQLFSRLGFQAKQTESGLLTQKTENWLFDGAHSYLRIIEQGHSIWRNIQDTQIVPFGGKVREVVSEKNWKKDAVFVPAFPIYPPEFSWIREEGNIPGIYSRTLESGARVVYLAADIDRCYGRNHIPDCRRVLEGCISWALRNRFRVKVSASAHVGISSYQQENQEIIHLINLAGTRVPVGTLEESISVGPVKVLLNTDRKIKAVYGICDEKPYYFTKSQDQIEITLPKIKEQEIIVITYQERQDRT